jgi:hypothetical protein
VSYTSQPNNSKSKKVTKVIGPTIKTFTQDFEPSENNAIRSVKVMYSQGLLSKEKYKAVRSNLCVSSGHTSKKRKSYQIMKGLRIPKLLSYDKVKEFIDNIFHNVKYHV